MRLPSGERATAATDRSLRKSPLSRRRASAGTARELASSAAANTFRNDGARIWLSPPGREPRPRAESKGAPGGRTSRAQPRQGLTPRERRPNACALNPVSSDRRPAPALAGQGAMFAVWLTAAIALGGSALSDRVAAYQIICAAAFAALGLVVPLAALQMTAPRLGRGAPALGSALCVLFAAALSLDLLSAFRLSALGLARLSLLGAAVALAAYHLWRGRFSRLGLGTAMAVLCLAWVLCGVLRLVLPQRLTRLPVVLPLLAGIAVLAPGLPILDSSRSRLRRYLTLGAAAALALLVLHGPPAP